MEHNTRSGFGSPCLGDLWRLEELQKQIEISGQWLNTYLHAYHSLLKEHPPNRPKLESLQLKILTEASFLQNQLKQHTALSQRNKDSFSITSSAFIQQAQQLLYAAQTALITPIKP